jgi:hypothetical protein
MEFSKVVKDDSSVLMFAKMQIEGRGTGLEKHDWLKIIKGRAADLYGETVTPEQAFSRTIVEDETGRLLYKALKAAPGFEVKPATGWNETKGPADPKQDFIGPAHAKLHPMAVDHQRAHSGMSYQQAYSHLYSRPENQALREEIKSEHMKATMARMHG